MKESIPTPKPLPVEKQVADLGPGSTVIRNGIACTIDTYQRESTGEIALKFSDGTFAQLEPDDTLEVPAQ